MSEEITRDLFMHLVELAALELSDEEAEYLRGQLNNQLKSIHELEAIPLDPGTPIAAHGVPFTPERSAALRPDVLRSFPQPAALLARAPESDEGYIVVPEIPHQDLS